MTHSERAYYARTEDPTRDLAPATRETVKRKLDRTLGRIFGEELPSGLVLATDG